MEWSIIQGILSLGVGGVLAVVIFIMYRRDKNATELRLSDMIDREIITREKFTETITELLIFLKLKNGN